MAGCLLVAALARPGAARGSGRAAHIEQVGVDPAFARRGLGRRLIEHVAAEARRWGLGALTLTTFRDVPWNGPWYARHGFTQLPPERWGPQIRTLWDAAKGAGRQS